MADIFSPEKRSQVMSGIRSRNTRPELIIRKALHAKGFRYRIADSRLVGKPDLVFPKYHAVIFVHGCFWHGHDCHLFKWPATRQEFWEEKIRKNRYRDTVTEKTLLEAGWRILTVWECALKGKNRVPFDTLIQDISLWLENNEPAMVIRSKGM